MRRPATAGGYRPSQVRLPAQRGAAQSIPPARRELDASTERIVNYLSDSDIPINVVFFNMIADGDRRYLSRAWLIDPVETESKAPATKTKEPWNGEFYGAFGHDLGRHWDDERRHGFLAAGGTRHGRTLIQLQPRNRVWVNVPRQRYVGVSVVRLPAVAFVSGPARRERTPPGAPNPARSRSERVEPRRGRWPGGW
jgi:hypothetical protein